MLHSRLSPGIPQTLQSTFLTVGKRATHLFTQVVALKIRITVLGPIPLCTASSPAFAPSAYSMDSAALCHRPLPPRPLAPEKTDTRPTCYGDGSISLEVSPRPAGHFLGGFLLDAQQTLKLNVDQKPRLLSFVSPRPSIPTHGFQVTTATALSACLATRGSALCVRGRRCCRAGCSFLRPLGCSATLVIHLVRCTVCVHVA